MAKYSLQNKNRYTDKNAQSVSFILVGFIILALSFLLLPLFKNPLLSVWNAVSLSTMTVATQEAPRSNFLDECVVLATPPRSEFDTLLVRCAPEYTVQENDNVWFDANGTRYLVGTVSTVYHGSIMAQLYSSSEIKSQSFRFDTEGEKFSAMALGGGVFRIEVPAEVEVNEGDKVYHTINNWPVGVVSGVELEKGSYIKRVYVRLPFSFETVQKVIITK